jgi:hypothetical protein
MKSNAAMRTLLAEATGGEQLNPALNAIVDRGFNVREGCYFLAALLPAAKNVTRDSFPDRTGYECFVNSIHVEDYDNKAPLCQAIQFVICAFSAWRAAVPALTLMSVVSADEFSVVVKFHVKRPAEQWLSENIEGYEDPILSVESSEDLARTVATLSRGAKRAGP